MFLRTFLIISMLCSLAMAADPSVQCIQSVCGTTSKASWDISSERKDPVAMADAAIVLEPALTKYLRHVVIQQQLADESFRAFLSMKSFPTLEAKAVGFVMGLRYLLKIKNFNAAIMRDAKNEYTIDRELLLKNYPQFTSAEVEALLSLNTNLNRFLTETFHFDYPFAVAAKLKYGKNVSLSVAQANIAREVLFSQDKMRAAFPGLRGIVDDDKVARKALKGKELSESEQRTLAQSYKTGLILNFFTDENILDKFSRIPMDLPSIQNEARAAYEVSEFKKAFNSAQDLKSLYQNAHKTCTDYLAYAYVALPTQAEINHFKTFIPAVKQTATEMLEQRKKSSIGNAFDVDYRFPIAQEDFIATAQNFLADQISETELNAARRMDLNSNDGFLSMLIRVHTKTDEKMFKNALETCEKLMPIPVEDAAFFGVGVLRVGRVSILNPELGVSVLAHEFGHLAQEKFAQDVSQETTCLSSKRGTSVYLNEDFADLFSAELVKRLRYRVNGLSIENIACAILPTKGNEFKTGSLVNPDSKDTHSSGFFRLIAYATMTQGLTPQCKNVMKSANETIFTNYCSWR